MAEWVPIIDLRGAPDDVAAALDRACRGVGFLVIVGHGVPAPVVDAAWTSATTFFDLPSAEKHSVAMPYPGYPYGYSPFAAETLARSRGQSAPPDLKESFAIGPLTEPRRPRNHDEAAAYSPNLWPAALPSLRPAWEAYYHEMADLAARLVRICATALDLPAEHFDPLIDRHPSALRALNYPPVERPPAAGQLRAGAHTDYGTLTILLQDDAPGGLQVQHPDGTWRPVPAVPGSFVVNLGDAMQRWTNDRWVSTMHRVVPPPDDVAGTARRQSIAFFPNANWEARIECLRTCLADGETPRYAPIEAGPHLMAKFRSTVT